MADSSFLDASISEIADLYRKRELTPVEVTTAALERIDRLNPTLNAFITVTHEIALRQARQAQTEMAQGEDRGPLHGIPVAIKDLVNVASVPMTAGSNVLRDHIAESDASVVTRLREAGAVLVGKTNLLEFAYGIVHPDYGQTNNPWNPALTAGGSSGGSAAAVAAGMCYAAFGTDTGGSIRVPAAYCGVVGLKPTYGVVDLDGVFPLSWSLDHGGPLTRSCEDAALFLDALIGHSGAETVAPLRLPSVAGLRLGVLAEHLTGNELAPAVLDAFNETVARLRDAGAQITEISVPELDLADRLLLTLVAPEAATIHAKWVAERPEDYAPLTRWQIELGFAVPVTAYVRGQQFRRYFARLFLDAMENVDAVLSPTVPWVAPSHDPVVADDEGAAEGRRTSLYNLNGFPALTIPCGLSAEKLPIGIQIATRPHQDRLALAIGARIEEVLATKFVPSMPDTHSHAHKPHQGD